LKAGVMRETGGLERTVTGTPQGGIASPLFANIALTALDRRYQADWERMSWHGSSRQALRRKGYPTYRLVRFADDRVPRTLKEARCRTNRRTRCCTRDGGWPSAAALQGEAANHRELRRSRAGVVSVAEKARRERVRCGSRRRAQANH
ncbi:MAG TPA: hypothetical protein VFE09_06265, partial [Rubrobacteraceae bacterium]|nr:hypothetical protein [Rubrobacteraceae bacterium]